ncbi:MAG: hypothetical protein KCHDKBKB_01811 [Elusimicrobia bacterium]|nr:hypothetical protein [Elusimicrobiota bacterium]
MKLTVAIVSFNTRELLLKCIQSVLDFAPSSGLEVMVVDNASSDGSATAVKKTFPTVEVIENPTNEFMPKAYNRAFLKAKGEFFLILSSDIEFKDDILKTMISTMEHDPHLGAVGSNLYYADDRLQKNCSEDYSYELALYNFTFLGKIFRKRSAKLNQEIFYADWDRQSDREVKIIPDSLLLVRKSLFGADFYDERFLLYFTENDLCQQIRQKGFGLRHLGQGRTVHQESQSVKKVDPAFISKIYRNDIRAYYTKYYGIGPTLFLGLMIELTRFLIHVCIKLKIRSFKKNLVWGI